MRTVTAATLLLAATCAVELRAQNAPPADSTLGARVDSVARQVLASTGVPSASVAVVQGGRLAYAQAYGQAKLDPPTPALPTMRYGIGSSS